MGKQAEVPNKKFKTTSSFSEEHRAKQQRILKNRSRRRTLNRAKGRQEKNALWQTSQVHGH